MSKKPETKIEVKTLTAEQQVELSILDREVQLTKEAIQPKFSLVVAKKKELAVATESYSKAHADYTEAYKEILGLEAKISEIIN